MSKKVGEAYIGSSEKRRMDVFVASALTPIEMAFRAVARAQNTTGQSVIMKQQRIGANEVPFNLRKIRTLGEDNVTPISPVMDTFRQIGIDELPQIVNILRGEMSLVGRRPLIPDEFARQYEVVGHDREGAKLVDRHRRTSGQAKPGILSTHAIQGHRGDETVMNMTSRLELDIYDFENASYEHTMKLLRAIVAAMRHSELHAGNIRIQKASAISPER